MVSITKFRYTVDIPVNDIRICQRGTGRSHRHKLNYDLRIVTVTVKTGADIAKCQQRYHEHLSSQFFNGLLHKKPCRSKSPCVESDPLVQDTSDDPIPSKDESNNELYRQKNVVKKYSEKKEEEDTKPKVRRSDRNSKKQINYSEEFIGAPVADVVGEERDDMPVNSVIENENANVSCKVNEYDIANILTTVNTSYAVSTMPMYTYGAQPYCSPMMTVSNAFTTPIQCSTSMQPHYGYGRFVTNTITSGSLAISNQNNEPITPAASVFVRSVNVANDDNKSLTKIAPKGKAIRRREIQSAFKNTCLKNLKGTTGPKSAKRKGRKFPTKNRDQTIPNSKQNIESQMISEASVGEQKIKTDQEKSQAIRSQIFDTQIKEKVQVNEFNDLKDNNAQVDTSSHPEKVKRRRMSSPMTK